MKAVIFGLSSTKLLKEEKEFFQKHNPFGFILFKRNCTDPEQIKDLVIELRKCVNREDVPILIDQEGGRVARLKPPFFNEYPPALTFGKIAEESLEKAKEAAYKNYAAIAKDLISLGINFNCAPVVDLLFDNAHDIIGDRSFGRDPNTVANLARTVCEAFLSQGVEPIIKHIPGHGRAQVDSHLGLPIVDTSYEELINSDFKAFKNLADIKYAMTAHIIYSSIDAKLPATLSKKVIDVIRNEIGFKGIIMTDDLSMHALSGSFQERALLAIEAGCDLLLHCNGNMDEMQEIAENTPLFQR